MNTFDYHIEEDKQKFMDGVYGRYINVPEDTYHAHPYISQSDIKNFLELPAIYEYSKEHPKQTKPMDFGTMFHTYVLQPELFKTQYSLVDLEGRDKRCSAWKKHSKACEKIGLTPYSEGDLEILQGMKKNLDEHPHIPGFMKNTEKEVVYLFQQPDTEMNCKIRIDMEKAAGLCDLKTTQIEGGANEKKFDKSITQFGYHIQDQFYIDAWMLFHEELETNNFIFIISEAKPPYLCNYRNLHPDYLTIGRYVYLKGLIKLKEYLEDTPKYKGYPIPSEPAKPSDWYMENYQEYHNI